LQGADVSAEASPLAEERKRYLQPTLQRYGRLVDVTRFGGSVVADSGVGSLGQL
jgi:hypothetical protein